MSKGIVYLIGAGPGSSDLITLRGLRAIKFANVLIIDSLLPSTFLDELNINKTDKEIHLLLENGRRKTQDQINQIMLDSVVQGKIVARIKTGDPHIFGRGLEEQVFLTGNNIRWEYVPGISVLSAGLGMADMALTKRETARSFAVVSARCSGGDINLDLPQADSLIIFMGVSALGEAVNKLKEQGWKSDTPAAILERACMSFQKQISGNLKNIITLATENNIQAPAVLVVGAAAKQYSFDRKRPSILFTGLDPANFRILGKIIHWPVIKVKLNETLEKSLPEIFRKLQNSEFKYIVITSKISARLFSNALSSSNFDNRIFASTKLIVAGKGTSELIAEAGLNADIIPDDYGSRGILEKTKNLDPGKVLIIQSATATEEMANYISKDLGPVEHLRLHEVVPNTDVPDTLPLYDVIYFTCPSAVRAFYKKYGQGGLVGKVWCIGDVTQKQLKEFNIDSEIVAPYVS